MKYSVEDFFVKKFENESNELLIGHRGLFSEEAMEEYVLQLTDISMSDYISYSESHPQPNDFTSKDITQLSNINDCTINMCNMMISTNNIGMNLIQIAKALHVDKAYKFNDVALTKYGENQVKTASQLGLTILRGDLWYLTSIGYVYPNINPAVQNKLLSMMLLRDPFYSKVLCSLYNKDICLKDFMKILSESTQNRRISSCMKLIGFFLEQCKKENIILHSIKTK